MKLNFDVLKGQMGFNNPQVETNRFSLRYELFRINDNDESDATWREQLEASRVYNLWDIPEFRRYARPFAPEEAGPQPGLVITFATNVLFGLNFFGNELGPNDSAYDSSQFSTRIRGVGTWFEDYAGLPLANTPSPVQNMIILSPPPLPPKRGFTTLLKIEPKRYSMPKDVKYVKLVSCWNWRRRISSSVYSLRGM